MKNKLAPKNIIDPTAAKKNADGVLVTGKEELKNLYLETYKARLAPNEVPDDLVELKRLKEYLFTLNKRIAKTEKTIDWTLVQLEKVLKSLKNGKARDAHGHIYELYKYSGHDLKCSMLRMFNMMKKKQVYPTIFQPSNISSFYKKKGDKSDLNNDRGVFNVVKIRSILDKLIYNDIYDKVDSSMSFSNIGARRNRNIRDHLFVINGVLNDVQQNKNNNSGVDVGIYDIEKCFDKMCYAETSNDLYKAGVKDDKFIMVTNSNKECQVAVKTPWGGLTDRITLSEIEMQGTVLSNIKCSVQIDSLGKDCITENKGLYKYKGCISIPPLSMVDDVVTISSCGSDSVKVNAIVQAKVQSKQLKLGQKKCFNMHVGKKNKHLCPVLKVHGLDMKTAERERYLGDILTTDGRIEQNINDRYQKAIGKVNEIIRMPQEVSFGPHYFQMALLFRSSILLSSMLCNAEVLYGVTNAHVEKLEQADRIFFRRLFEVPNCTAIEAFHLETSTIPVRFLLMKKRLNYYWDILQLDESELVKKVYNGQRTFSVKNDWFLQIKSDLEVCDITLSESEIRGMKEHTIRKLIKEKISLISAQYLIKLRGKHSKSINLKYSDKIQPYLRNEELSIQNKKLMFRIRNRLIDVKTNFKKKYNNNLECRLCSSPEESQSHLVECIEIVNDVEVMRALDSHEYSDIFSPELSIQTKLVKAWQLIMKTRKMKLKKLLADVI